MFDHFLEKEVASDATSWLDVPELCDGARVELAYAGETNHGYYNAMLKMAGSRARMANREINKETMDTLREEDRKLFGQFIVMGWAGVRDKDGELVEFSRDLAKEFCQKIPTYVFDKIRNAAGTPERFTDLPIPDAAELAGN